MKVLWILTLSILVGSHGALAAPVEFKTKFRMPKFLMPDRAVSEVDDVFAAKGFQAKSPVASDGGDHKVIHLQRNYEKVTVKGEAATSGRAYERYEVTELDEKAYRVLDRKVMEEQIVKADGAAAGALWQVEGQRVFTDGKTVSNSSGELLHKNGVLFTLKEKGQVQKTVLVHFNDSLLFPEGSEIIGFKMNADLSRYHVQILSNGKVKEHEFKVVKGDQRLVGSHTLSLSDFYAGAIRVRQNADEGVRGLQVHSGNY